MNEEKWVLAILKRKLLELKSKAELYTERDIYENILNIIATAESDAILGTQELAEEFANKLPDTLPGGDACDDDSCGIHFENVEGVDF